MAYSPASPSSALYFCSVLAKRYGMPNTPNSSMVEAMELVFTREKSREPS